MRVPPLLKTRVLLTGILCVHVGLLGWNAATHSPVYDEVGHLPAGISHWHFQRFELYRVNPPLVRMVAAAPVVLARPRTDWTQYREGPGARAEFPVGRDFIAVNGPRSFWYFTLARWACVPFSLLGAVICCRWARELHGETAGLVALTLWCFCPNILAHGALLTPDVGAAAVGLAAAYLFWRWLKDPAWSRAAAAGLVFGLAQLTKMTWITLFALWPAVWVAWRLCDRAPPQSRIRLTQGRQLVVVLLIGLLVLNLGYGFEGSFQRLDGFPFVSAALSGRSQPTLNLHRFLPSGNRFAGTWLGKMPVPLPRNYVLGLDTQKGDFERKDFSYLKGEFRHGGWWHYYLYAAAVKVPLGTWLLFALALIPSADGSTRRRDSLMLLCTPAAVLLLVSSQTGINNHFRYALPAFPFVFVWIGRVARPGFLAGSARRTAVAAGLAWSIASSLWVFPHSLSYFNELAGGPRNGHAHLLGSNLDWGQDLLYLKAWLDLHPEATPLGLAHNGRIDPRAAGISFGLPPAAVPLRAARGGRTVPPSGPQPGWFAVSVSLLHGQPHVICDDAGGLQHVPADCYSYFRRFEPVDMAGYSIYIYHITPEEAKRVRGELGLP